MSPPPGELAQRALELGLDALLVGFTDLLGAARAKLVPAAGAGRLGAEGLSFAGSGHGFDHGPERPDLTARPDPASLIALPWAPGTGWVRADLFAGEEPFGQCPRRVLEGVAAPAAGEGVSVVTGVECEFYLLDPAGGDPAPPATRPCYDAPRTLAARPVLAAIAEALTGFGWGPLTLGQEEGPGQFEVTWPHAEPLVTADRHVLAKLAVKGIAAAHGLRASFMPKLHADLPGTGCHVHASLARHGEPGFGPGGAMSTDGRAALAGVLARADALAALTNPCVNSYKRLDPSRGSGSWLVPVAAGYAVDARTQMLRVLPAGRFECRLPDGAANPYLLQAGLLAAMLDGVRQGLDPGPPAGGPGEAPPGVRRLPTNLLDALRALKRDPPLMAALGPAGPAFLRLKTEEWHASTRAITPWERETTLDC